MVRTGRWSDPILRHVVHDVPAAMLADISVTSGAEDPPDAGFSRVAEPSFRMQSVLSLLHSSIARPRASSGWWGSQAIECALTSPQIMQRGGSGSPAGWNVWA